MKKVLSLFLICCFLIAACSCTGGEKPEPKPDPAPDPEKLDAALAAEFMGLVKGVWVTEDEGWCFATFTEENGKYYFSYGMPWSDFREGGEITRISKNNSVYDFTFVIPAFEGNEMSGSREESSHDAVCDVAELKTGHIDLNNFANKGDTKTFRFLDEDTDHPDFDALIPKFTVSFDSNGGSACEPIILEEGMPLTGLPVPTKEGYDFVCWQDQNEVPILDGALLTAEDITLFAKWQKQIVSFKVRFDSKGGSKCSSITVKEGKKLPKLPVPTREGYRFVCWKDKNEVPIMEGALLTPHDITLYAAWEKSSFTITFDSQGGSECKPITVQAGDPLPKLPVPTRAGYKFIFWVDQWGVYIDEGALLSCEDLILYARWEKIE